MFGSKKDKKEFLDAMASNNAQKLKQLLSGNKYEVSTADLNTIIFKATRENNIDLIRICVQSPSMVKFLNIVAPVAHALKMKRTETVRALLDSGIDLNHRDKWGRTILNYAAMYNDLAVVQELLERVARPNMRNNWGITAIHDALDSRIFVSIPDALEASIHLNTLNPATYGSANSATEKQSYDIIECLLAHGANPNIIDHWGENALHKACSGPFEILSLIIQYGRDCTTQNDEGWNPLHHVAHGPLEKSAEKAELLIAHGARVNQHARYGGTPLHTAVANQQDAMVEVLIEHGADINAVAWAMRTPLYLAIEQGTLFTCENLLRNGASFDARTRTGRSPLQAAYLLGQEDKMKLLLAYHATVYNEKRQEEYFSPNYPPNRLGHVLLAHIAILKFRGKYVNEKDISNLIKHHPLGSNHYNKALGELQLATVMKALPRVTYYQILTKPLPDLLQYARNEGALYEARFVALQEYEVYSKELHRKLWELLEVRREWKKTETRLNAIFSEYLPEPVVERIAYFLVLQENLGNP